MDEREIVLSYKDVVLRGVDLHALQGPCYLTDQIIAFYFSYLSSLYDPKEEDILLVHPSVSFFLAHSLDENLGDFMEPLKLSTKKLVLFPVNDCTDFDGGESGAHWSLVVYDRTKNSFSHLDSIAGANHLHALHIYKSLKGFMGPSVATQPPQSMKNEEKKKPPASSSPAPIADAIPEFVEVPSPQQKNGYDCGIYVIAIARAICQWFSSPRNNNRDVDWVSFVQKHVDASVEITMRGEIIKLIQELRDA
ncbi:unnamed protein product [Cuscuta epithymum]|uniref:Ubiquitin-like protease family profile domain-containing protein n=1 Tax=Cuscuta epithymum TaxID=186058 RepID=A0AAV0DTC3_9ASTE|nr:unnamed protein product [Cuscuta epithymum]